MAAPPMIPSVGVAKPALPQKAVRRAQARNYAREVAGSDLRTPARQFTVDRLPGRQEETGNPRIRPSERRGKMPPLVQLRAPHGWENDEGTGA